MSSENQSDDENILAEANNLAGLIDYQKGSVVSKTIIAKKTGTITLFAFDKGQGLSEHSASFDAMVYILDGEAEITVSGRETIVKNGEMILLPANKPQRFAQ
jgi:quercetin dioxygenase-like cupin family protein